MSAHVPTQGNSLPSLATAPWLASPEARAVLAALAAAGHEGRFVGGTVRNTLMGVAVSDLDIATPARPEQVVEACRRAGLETVPTGLEHGTVTVVAHHRPIEVTTLRRDVATDGRRATVAFTHDWAEDAQRRDFTMNALYCDGVGRLYDPVGGYPDLVARRVRFIGDPDQRIAEDYLRILRFFRFHASYAHGAPDAAALAACARGLKGMALLSAERVRAEIVKLLVAPGAVAAVEAMGDIGLTTSVLGAAPRPGLLAAVATAEARAGAAPDAMLRLAALAVAVEDDCARIADRLRLSTAERKALIVGDRRLAQVLAGIDERRARAIVYRRGPTGAMRAALMLQAVAPEQSADGDRLIAMTRGWTALRLPVSGGDAVALGLTPGPSIGEALAETEDWWIANDFPPRAETLAALADIVARLQARGGGNQTAV